MTSADFPLTRAAGLSVRTGYVTRELTSNPEYSSTHQATWVDAFELERWLTQAPVVYARNDREGWDYGYTNKEVATHSYRAVCIEPLRSADTPESLLRELVSDPQGVATGLSPSFYDRARKLLEGK